MSSLSSRGLALLGGSMPTYLLEHFERSQRPFGPDAPDGYLGLCVAENALVWDLLEPRVREARAVPAARFAYDDMRGCFDFRAALAELFSARLAERPIDPDHIAVLAGAGSVLETVFYALGDPGDGVLVPTPSYAGFWMDLEVRDALRIIPVHGASEDDFRVGPEHYEGALARADRPVRALLLTNPDNPRGTVMSKAELEAILVWAESRGLHVILDEVYAFSVFGIQPHSSVLALRPKLGPSVHVVWAFSKDFAASGLRCGVLVTENEELMRAVDGLAYWSCVSGDTQFLLSELLRDGRWLDRYLLEMPARLGSSYRAVAQRLDAMGVPYTSASAGFFLLADLRAFLKDGDDGDGLWRRLLDDANLNFTPGSACRIHEPGFMRICHAAVSSAEAKVAMDRLERTLSGPAS